MKRLVLSFAGVAGLIAMASTPAAAQVASGNRPEPGGSGYEALGNPSDVNILATTPSRLRGSRREMNRGRHNLFEVRMSPRETRVYAGDLLERAEIDCDVADAMVVARTTTNMPVVEVDCIQGGGLVVADTLPIQATDCLDLWPAEGSGEPELLQACRLPGNVASVAAARQSVRN
ncbi:hypothetical protein N0B44_16100 [Roseibacterium beibuensis]|uniref:hypothetical protein n=1 Tax=[Roseibacterium] beibuensis TaxID=1193142 RepID=UPI00217E88A5|nr:hypothetical protein [Roseibacterium beibuensis]MCS6624442.1 hypothetical protein [Roseibacterium beibuensis]